MVIDEATRRRTATLDAGKFITGIAVDEQFDTLYATNLLDNTVTIFDGQTNAVIDTVAVTLLPAAIAVDSQTHKAYITDDARANTVAVVDAR
jgi:YVTN family beta-propeller protein